MHNSWIDGLVRRRDVFGGCFEKLVYGRELGRDGGGLGGRCVVMAQCQMGIVKLRPSSLLFYLLS